MKEVYWSGVVQCDIDSSHKLNGVMYDARLPSHGGSWGCVCFACFDASGASLGTGRGQKYRQQDNGRWLKVAG